jgi:hypothetical protein
MEVVPNANFAVEGGGTSLSFFCEDSRTKQIFLGSSQISFGGGALIRGMSVRCNGGYPGEERTLNFASYQVEISQADAASAAVGQLASATFFNNQGAGLVTVRSGPLNVPGYSLVGLSTPNPFSYYVVFTTPYVYAAGTDIVITIRHTGNGIHTPIMDAVWAGASVNDALFNTSDTSLTGTRGSTPEVIQLVQSVPSAKPEMHVFDLSGNPVHVTSGGSYGVIGVVAVTSVVALKVLSWGPGTLTLATPVAAPAGVLNCTATITTQPVATIQSGGLTGIGIEVTPLAAGNFGFSITIGNNDPDENPYSIYISGFTTSPSPEMDIVEVADGGTRNVQGAGGGGTSVVTHTIKNSGSSDLALVTPVSSITVIANCTATVVTQPNSLVVPGGTTVLAIAVTPLAAGPFSCFVSVVNNDINENPYDWTISGTAVATPEPEMDVLPWGGFGAELSQTGVDQLNLVSFGTPQTESFKITNRGSATLSLIGSTPIVVTPSVNIVTASISGMPSSSIAPGDSASLTISYTVGTSGLFLFTVSIANNDSTENPYAFSVRGTGEAVAELAVSRGAEILDGGAEALGLLPSGTPSSYNYTISNIGESTLWIMAPQLIKARMNCSVAISVVPSASVAPAGATTMTISVTALSTGSFSFIVQIYSNDAEECPFDWTVSGTASGPEMDVLRRDARSGRQHRFFWRRFYGRCRSDYYLHDCEQWNCEPEHYFAARGSAGFAFELFGQHRNPADFANCGIRFRHVCRFGNAYRSGCVLVHAQY